MPIGGFCNNSCFSQKRPRQVGKSDFHLGASIFRGFEPLITHLLYGTGCGATTRAPRTTLALADNEVYFYMYRSSESDGGGCAYG